MKGLSVVPVTVGGYDRNISYVVADRGSGEVLVVDPCGDFGKAVAVVAAIGGKVRGIAVTHMHFDHRERLGDACARWNEAPVYAHTSARFSPPVSHVPLEDGDEIPLAENGVRVWHTPGHHPTSLCFLIDREAAEDHVPKIITGDTLFIGGCGRTDAEGVADLYASLQRLRSLPDETVVYPGHDYGSRPFSTIGCEKRQNAYLRAKSLEEFIKLRLGGSPSPDAA